MQPKIQEVTSKTKDFYHAVVVKTLGIPLVGLEKGDGNYAYFVFGTDKTELEQIITEYWEGKIVVNAKDLIANIHELKTRLHAREEWKK